MLQTAYHLLHLYGYPLVIFMIALECAGLLVPGETVLLAASLFASHGHLNIFLVVASASLGAVIGNLAGYGLGRVLGHTLLSRYGGRVGLTRQRLAVGRYLYALHGGKMVFFGRFGVVLRSFSPVLAGANDMPLRPFFLVDGGGRHRVAEHSRVRRVSAGQRGQAGFRAGQHRVRHYRGRRDRAGDLVRAPQRAPLDRRGVALGGGPGARVMEGIGMTFEPDALTRNERQVSKSFLVLFFKKEQGKVLLFEKRSKNFC
ncbi:MAG: DedA family protein [Rhodospirillales bacterium]